jgi:ribonuclease HI
MELTAALEALRTFVPGASDGRSVEVVSDSTYVVNCFKQRWWEGWLRRGWRNTQNKPVANRDLWEPMLALVLDGGIPVSFTWVKGHSADKWNDEVDRLATQAAGAGQGISGP